EGLPASQRGAAVRELHVLEGVFGSPCQHVQLPASSGHKAGRRNSHPRQDQVAPQQGRPADNGGAGSHPEVARDHGGLSSPNLPRSQSNFGAVITAARPRRQQLVPAVAWRQQAGWVVWIAAALVLLLLVLVPLAWLALSSFQDSTTGALTLRNYASTFSKRIYLEPVLNSFKL